MSPSKLNMESEATVARNTVWQCKVGCIGPLEVPQGGDMPMRDAIGRAFWRTVGVEAEFTFSGWGSDLTEGELAVVEDRLPDRSKVTREIPFDVTDEMIKRAAAVLNDYPPEADLALVAGAVLRAALEDPDA